LSRVVNVWNETKNALKYPSSAQSHEIILPFLLFFFLLLPSITKVIVMSQFLDEFLERATLDMSLHSVEQILVETRLCDYILVLVLFLVYAWAGFK